MDSPNEALDYDAMNHRAVNQSFVTDLLGAAAGPLADYRQQLEAGTEVGRFEVLDLGTGTAQIPIELCRQNDEVSVLACDLAASMLDLAIRNIDVAGFRQRILLSQTDAKELPYPDGRFAIVMSNSIVHHIPQPSVALREAVRVLAPGGLIFIRDLLRPGDDVTIRHLVATYAADGNQSQRDLFEASLRAALSLDEIRAIVAELGCPPERVVATSDRHWTWSARTGGLSARE
jgi:ubiquinone/menaquinone biosynthesis C-methylase UbiE